MSLTKQAISIWSSKEWLNDYSDREKSEHNNYHCNWIYPQEYEIFIWVHLAVQ